MNCFSSHNKYNILIFFLVMFWLAVTGSTLVWLNEMANIPCRWFELVGLLNVKVALKCLLVSSTMVIDMMGVFKYHQKNGVMVFNGPGKIYCYQESVISGIMKETRLPLENHFGKWRNFFNLTSARVGGERCLDL